MDRKNRFNRSASRRSTSYATRYSSNASTRASGSSAYKQYNNLRKRVSKVEKTDPTFVVTYGSQLVTNSWVNATPQAILLNGITQGDTQLTRDGVKVNWKSLKIRFLIKSSATTTVPNFFRILIVREESCLGSAVSPTQLLNDATPDVLASYNVTNRNVKDRYKVYWDSGPMTIGPYVTDYTSASANVGTVIPPIRFITKKIKFNFVTDYSRGNAGTVADIDTNSLYFLAFTDNSSASNFELYYSHTLYGQDK